MALHSNKVEGTASQPWVLMVLMSLLLKKTLGDCVVYQAITHKSNSKGGDNKIFN